MAILFPLLARKRRVGNLMSQPPKEFARWLTEWTTASATTASGSPPVKDLRTEARFYSLMLVALCRRTRYEDKGY